MGVRLYVEGPLACFTRPEGKAERVSYEVPTPSACRGILEAIHWKPAIAWKIDRIHVLRPIVFDNIRRNEIKKKGPSEAQIRKAMRDGDPLFIDAAEERVQRAALLLRDVAYIIEAHFEMTDKAGPTDNPGKHLDIFNRRVEKGSCHHQPCFGCREFPAYFRPAGDEVSELANDAPRDLGIMLYDIDFSDNMKSLFYLPRLEHGIINVERDKERTLCHHI